MSYMNNKNFWLSDFDVHGVFKAPKKLYDSLFQNKIYNKLAKVTLKKTPLWVEMTYMNSLNNNNSTREYLLGTIFSMLHKDYLTTLNLADKGYELFHDDIFITIRRATIKEIKKSFIKDYHD